MCVVESLEYLLTALLGKARVVAKDSHGTGEKVGPFMSGEVSTFFAA